MQREAFGKSLMQTSGKDPCAAYLILSFSQDHQNIRESYLFHMCNNCKATSGQDMKEFLGKVFFIKMAWQLFDKVLHQSIHNLMQSLLQQLNKVDCKVELWPAFFPLRSLIAELNFVKSKKRKAPFP